MATKRSRGSLAIMMMASAALGVGCTTSSGEKPVDDTSKSPHAYVDTQARRDYQVTLNRASNRIASNVPSVINGRLYVAERKTGPKFLQECTGRCATIAKYDDGYHLMLPVGFTYRETNSQLAADKKEYEAVPVTKVTYWDPVTHDVRSMVSATLASVPAPATLKHQNIKDLKRDHGGFISNYDIVETKSGGLKVADYAELVNEPGGALYDGDDRLVVPVFNQNGKLVICTKNNWVPALYTDRPYTTKFLSANTIKTC